MGLLNSNRGMGFGRVQVKVQVIILWITRLYVCMAVRVQELWSFRCGMDSFVLGGQRVSTSADLLCNIGT